MNQAPTEDKPHPYKRLTDGKQGQAILLAADRIVFKTESPSYITGGR